MGLTQPHVYLHQIVFVGVTLRQVLCVFTSELAFWGALDKVLCVFTSELDLVVKVLCELTPELVFCVGLPWVLCVVTSKLCVLCMFYLVFYVYSRRN